jgi:hypothetical protein
VKTAVFHFNRRGRAFCTDLSTDKEMNVEAEQLKLMTTCGQLCVYDRKTNQVRYLGPRGGTNCFRSVPRSVKVLPDSVVGVQDAMCVLLLVRRSFVALLLLVCCSFVALSLLFRCSFVALSLLFCLLLAAWFASKGVDC